jgi:hypothetical protein
LILAKSYQEEAESATRDLQASLASAEKAFKDDTSQWTSELEKIRYERAKDREATQSAMQSSALFERNLAELTLEHESALSAKVLQDAELTGLRQAADEFENTVSRLSTEMQTIRASSTFSIRELKSALDFAAAEAANAAEEFNKLNQALLAQKELKYNTAKELEASHARVAENSSKVSALIYRNEALTETIARLEAAVEYKDRAAAEECAISSLALQRAEETMASETARLDEKYAEAFDSIEADTALRVELAVANAKAEANRAAKATLQEERLAHNAELDFQTYEAQAAYKLAAARACALERVLEEERARHVEYVMTLNGAAEKRAEAQSMAHEVLVFQIQRAHDTTVGNLKVEHNSGIMKIEESHAKCMTQETKSFQNIVEEAERLRAELRDSEFSLAASHASHVYTQALMNDYEGTQAHNATEISRLKRDIVRLESDLHIATSNARLSEGLPIGGWGNSPIRGSPTTLLASRLVRTPNTKASAPGSASDLETARNEAAAYKKALEHALAVITVDESEGTTMVVPPSPKSAATYRTIAAAARAKAAARSLRARAARAVAEAAAAALHNSISPHSKEIAWSTGTKTGV